MPWHKRGQWTQQADPWPGRANGAGRCVRAVQRCRAGGDEHVLLAGQQRVDRGGVESGLLDQAGETGCELGGLGAGQHDGRFGLASQIGLRLLDDRLQGVQLCRCVGVQVVIALDLRTVVGVDRGAPGPGGAVPPVVVGRADPSAVQGKGPAVVAEQPGRFHPPPAAGLGAGTGQDPAGGGREDP